MYTMYMFTTFTATEIRKNWFGVLDEVGSKSRSVGVIKEGRLIAKIVPIVGKSRLEIKRSLFGLKNVLGKGGVFSSASWRRKENMYLKRISEGKSR